MSKACSFRHVCFLSMLLSSCTDPITHLNFSLWSKLDPGNWLII